MSKKLNYRIDIESNYQYLFLMPIGMINKIKRIVKYKRDSEKGKKYGGIRHFLIVAVNKLIEEETQEDKK